MCPFDLRTLDTTVFIITSFKKMYFYDPNIKYFDICTLLSFPKYTHVILKVQEHMSNRITLFFAVNLRLV